MAREDPKQIEAEAMAEIRAALNMYDPQPPTTISIPKLVKSPTSEKSTMDTSTDDEDNASLADEERELLVKIKDVVSRRSSTYSVDGGSSNMNDSFMKHLSCLSSVGGSSSGMSDSYQKLHVGTVREEGGDDELLSHLGAEDLSHDELLGAVQRLYEQLKKADESLASERRRRHSREKSLIKLAKELSRRKGMMTKLQSKADEMQDELKMVQSEKSLLEQRMQFQMRTSKDLKVESRGTLDREIHQVMQRYERIISEHDKRISEMNKTHAHQCEQLCREVVDANQESTKLKHKLAVATNGAFVVETAPKSLRSSFKPKEKRSKLRRWLMTIFFVLLFSYFGFLLGVFDADVEIETRNVPGHDLQSSSSSGVPTKIKSVTSSPSTSVAGVKGVLSLQAIKEKSTVVAPKPVFIPEVKLVEAKDSSEELEGITHVRFSFADIMSTRPANTHRPSQEGPSMDSSPLQWLGSRPLAFLHFLKLLPGKTDSNLKAMN